MAFLRAALLSALVAFACPVFLGCDDNNASSAVSIVDAGLPDAQEEGVDPPPDVAEPDATDEPDAEEDPEDTTDADEVEDAGDDAEDADGVADAGDDAEDADEVDDAGDDVEDADEMDDAGEDEDADLPDPRSSLFVRINSALFLPTPGSSFLSVGSQSAVEAHSLDFEARDDHVELRELCFANMLDGVEIPASFEGIDNPASHFTLNNGPRVVASAHIDPQGLLCFEDIDGDVVFADTIQTFRVALNLEGDHFTFSAQRPVIDIQLRLVYVHAVDSRTNLPLEPVYGEIDSRGGNPFEFVDTPEAWETALQAGRELKGRMLRLFGGIGFLYVKNPDSNPLRIVAEDEQAIHNITVRSFVEDVRIEEIGMGSFEPGFPSLLEMEEGLPLVYGYLAFGNESIGACNRPVGAYVVCPMIDLVIDRNAQPANHPLNLRVAFHRPQPFPNGARINLSTLWIGAFGETSGTVFTDNQIVTDPGVTARSSAFNPGDFEIDPTELLTPSFRALHEAIPRLELVPLEIDRWQTRDQVDLVQFEFSVHGLDGGEVEAARVVFEFRGTCNGSSEELLSCFSGFFALESLLTHERVPEFTRIRTFVHPDGFDLVMDQFPDRVIAGVSGHREIFLLTQSLIEEPEQEFQFDDQLSVTVRFGHVRTAPPQEFFSPDLDFVWTNTPGDRGFFWGATSTLVAEGFRTEEHPFFD